MELERAVILEELAAVEDAPEEFLWEEFSRTFWLDHPLGTPILGTRETIKSLSCDDLSVFFRRAYEPANVVVAAAGRLEHSSDAVAITANLGSSPHRGPFNTSEFSARRSLNRFTSQLVAQVPRSTKKNATLPSYSTRCSVAAFHPGCFSAFGRNTVSLIVSILLLRPMLMRGVSGSMQVPDQPRRPRFSTVSLKSSAFCGRCQSRPRNFLA